MRVVHVITRLYRAGAEENTLASCRAQAARGHEVHLIHGRDFDETHWQELRGTVRLHRVRSLVHPVAVLSDLRATFALVRKLRKLRPDVVHTHQSKAGILGRIAARIARVPHIVHGVHIVPFVNVSRARAAVYLTAEKIAASFTDAFIDVSKGMRDTCLSHRVGPATRHHVIHSGFRLEKFQNAAPPADWPELLRVPLGAPRPPVLVMMAAYEPRKRHNAFLDVLPGVIARLPDLRVVLVGDGPCRAEVEDRIRDLRLETHVIQTGFRRDPERLVALADLCVLTSSHEGLPRVILQYLAAGKPCVVSDLPGLDEVLRHDRNAIIVPPDNLGAAADQIANLLEDRDALARLARGAARTDLSSWDVDLMCDRIEAVYQSLARAQSNPGAKAA